MCLDASASCSVDSDCDVCEECVRSPNHDFAVCKHAGGIKCAKDEECKQNQAGSKN